MALLKQRSDLCQCLARCDPSTIPSDVTDKVKQILAPYSIEDVKHASRDVAKVFNIVSVTTIDNLEMLGFHWY